MALCSDTEYIRSAPHCTYVVQHSVVLRTYTSNSWRSPSPVLHSARPNLSISSGGRRHEHSDSMVYEARRSFGRERLLWISSQSRFRFLISQRNCVCRRSLERQSADDSAMDRGCVRRLSLPRRLGSRSPPVRQEVGPTAEFDEVVFIMSSPLIQAARRVESDHGLLQGRDGPFLYSPFCYGSFPSFLLWHLSISSHGMLEPVPLSVCLHQPRFPLTAL